jgi:cold shock CspA family protein
MQIPVDITYKDMEPTDALNLRNRDWVAKLERVYDRITRCEVLVEQPHRHHRKGREFHVRVRMTVPGGELVVSHDPGPNGAHEDAYVALRDTFTAARRQLEEYVRTHVQRGSNERTQPAHAKVSFVDIEGEWGWLEPSDGRRIYFHRNSVLGGIDGLAVGSEVRFTEEQGDQGPQATTVERIGANGRHEMTAGA